MSAQVFGGLFILAAAALAVWTVVRFPRWAPVEFRRALIHMGLSMVAMYLLAPYVTDLLDHVAEPFQTHLSMFAVLMPALVYRFVSAIWLLRLAQGALGSAMR